MRAATAKIAIVGGGVYLARLCELLAASPQLPTLDLTVSGRRLHRLTAIVHHSAIRLKRLRPDWRLYACSSLENAVADATCVVLLVRVGGLEARAHDESFPARFGLVGDEGLGPGGMANAWRTLPALEPIAQTIAQHAPRAIVLNLMAPLGMTTRLLLDAGLDAVGLCELPSTTRSKLLEFGVPRPGSEDLGYAGMNHLGWFWGRTPLGRDSLSHAARSGLVDAPTLSHFEAAPLHYYYRIFDREAAARLGLVHTGGRAERLISLDHRIFAQLSDSPGNPIDLLLERPTPWFDHALVPALTALLGGPSYAGFANVRCSDPWIADPSQIQVGEVEATFSSMGVRSHPAPATPAPVCDFLAAASRSESLTYRAVRQRDPEIMKRAVYALPYPRAPRFDVDALVDAICTPIDVDPGGDRSAALL